MAIQAGVLLQQTDRRTDQTQLTASVPTRCHPTQPGNRLRKPRHDLRYTHVHLS
jgi:hypothetical protein